MVYDLVQLPIKPAVKIFLQYFSFAPMLFCCALDPRIYDKTDVIFLCILAYRNQSPSGFYFRVNYYIIPGAIKHHHHAGMHGRFVVIICENFQQAFLLSVWISHQCVLVSFAGFKTGVPSIYFIIVPPLNFPTT